MKHLIFATLLLLSFFCVKKVMSQKVFYQDTLQYTIPGDDGWDGTVTFQVMKFDTDSLKLKNDWGTCSSCRLVLTLPQPEVGGTLMTVIFGDSLMTGETYYFAMKVADEVPNWSGLSNIVSIYIPDRIAPAAIIDLRWVE